MQSPWPMFFPNITKRGHSIELSMGTFLNSFDIARYVCLTNEWGCVSLPNALGTRILFTGEKVWKNRSHSPGSFSFAASAILALSPKVPVRRRAQSWRASFLRNTESAKGELLISLQCSTKLLLLIKTSTRGTLYQSSPLG